MFDIDSLFIIKKQRLSTDFDISSLLNKYGIKSNLVFKSGDLIGADREIELVNNQPLSVFLHSAIIRIEKKLIEERNNRGDNLKEIEEDLRAVATYFDLAAKNEIVHLFSSNIRDFKNQADLLTPITFARVSKTKSDILTSFKDSLDEIKDELISSGLVSSSDFESRRSELEEKGIDILRKEGEYSLKAQKLLNKYSTQKEDSVLELFAKLEAEKQGIEGDLTTKQALELVNPKGTMHDPLTQTIIHSNTYAGTSLTGIAANTGKVLAYLFNTGRITEFTNGVETVSMINANGDYDNGLLSTFLREKGFNSLNALLYSNSEWKPSKREDPKLKIPFKMGGIQFSSLSRYEKSFDGDYKKAFEFGDTLINIFETIDTIINLAIDNVKEQKLFVLGITNSNSNAYMAGVSIGIPLNELALLFRSPAVARESAKNSFSAEKAANTLIEEIESMDVQDIFKLVEDYAPETLAEIKSIYAKSNDIRKALQVLDISLDYLNSSYKGYSNIVADYVLFKEIKKLENLGQEMFDYATVFSLLRSMPNEKGVIDSVVETGLKYQELATEEATKRGDEEIASKKDQIREQVIKEKTESIESSQSYQNASPTRKEEMLKSIEEYSDLIDSEVERRYQSSLVSRMIAGSVGKNFTPTSNSVFENMTIFTIPHVYTAWLVVKRLQYLIENTFAIHSTELKYYSDQISDALGIVYGRNAIRKLVPQEFFKFVTSDMKLHLPQGTIDFKTDPTEAASVSNGRTSSVVFGQDAWAHKFATEFEEFKSLYVAMNGENEFLSSVEVSTDSKGSKVLRITADKTSNPETVLKIKEGYNQLLKEESLKEGEIEIFPSAIALNLFKYSAISQGMFYTRTGFSMVFPISFSEAYSTELENHLSRVFEKDSLGRIDAMKTKNNLNKLLDTFTYQLVRNNPAILPYRKDYPITITSYTTPTGDRRKVYQGEENGIHFDLSYNSKDNPPRFISDYNKNAYILIGTENKKDYYRKITQKHNMQFYSFPLDMNNLLDMSILSNGSLQGTFIPKAYVNGNTIKFPFAYDIVNVGDPIFIHDYSSTSPDFIIKAKVTAASKSDVGYNYQIEYNGRVPLTTPIPSSEIEKLELLFQESASAATEFKDTTLPLIGTSNADINIDFTLPSSEIKDLIASIPKGEYRVPTNLFNDYYKLDSDSAISLAKLLKGKTNVNFDVLGLKESPMLDNVSGDVDVEISEENNLYVVLRNKRNSKFFKKVEENRFYFAGVDENNVPVYVYIRKLSVDKADIDLVYADVVSSFPTAEVTPEEMDEFIEKNCK